MNRLFTTLLLLTIYSFASGQTTIKFVDSLRIKYEIPELAYAVISADTILEMQILGVQRINTEYLAKPTDRFHIGSNTKAITSFISALLVEQGIINWNTKFIELFPELKTKSKKKYHSITLQNLLTFRGKLPAYTYTFDKPTQKQIKGDNANQRYLLAKYFLSQKPMQEQNGITPSNADYILAGLMLEKATGKTFKELVKYFGITQGIEFGFDYPNLADKLQPWGHNNKLMALPPIDNYKLNWLLSAGNINVSLTDYIKFIQLQLKGLSGKTTILSKEKFEKLIFGFPVFSFGWFNKTDITNNHQIAYNEGDAGAFISKVEIDKQTDQAFIILTNSSTEKTKEGISELVNYLEKKYDRLK